jgi:hypothetical protein
MQNSRDGGIGDIMAGTYPALKTTALWCIQHGVEIPADVLESLRDIGLSEIKGMDSRGKLERELAKVLAGALRGQLENLLEILGDPPDLSRLSEAFWIDAGKELMGAIMPVLQMAFINQASDFLEEQGIGVDWSLINKDAAEWARTYGFNLVSGLNDTTRELLQGAIGDYFTQGWTMGDLQDKLGQFYGPVRAESIAVTEVTRASVQGELATAEEVRRLNSNIVLTPVWQTNSDELVCEICGPYNQKTDEAWGDDYPDGPPAHPNCRCWLNHDVEVPE